MTLVMNNQERRSELMKEIIDNFKPNIIIETGTYQGHGSRWFSENSNADIFTVDNDPQFYNESKESLADVPRIKLALSNSVDWLIGISTDPEFTQKSTLFYLDAHWGAYLPLADEISVITKNWSNYIITIDDFFVEDDHGYGFDDYGPGKRIDKSIIPRWENEESRLFAYYPKAHSSTETGYLRGTMVLSTIKNKDLLDSLTFIRSTPLD